MKKRLVSLLLTLMMVLGLLPATAYAAVGQGLGRIGEAIVQGLKPMADPSRQYPVTFRKDPNTATTLYVQLYNDGYLGSAGMIWPSNNTALDGANINIGAESIPVESIIQGFNIMQFNPTYLPDVEFSYARAAWSDSVNQDITMLDYDTIAEKASRNVTLRLYYLPENHINVPVNAVVETENGTQTAITGAATTIQAGVLDDAHAQTILTNVSTPYILNRAELRHKTNHTTIAIGSIQQSGDYYYATSRETSNPIDVFSASDWQLYLVYEQAYTLTINVISQGTTWPNAASQTGNTINGEQIANPEGTYTFRLPVDGKLETTFAMSRYVNLKLTNTTGGRNTAVFSNHETVLGGYQTKEYTLVVDGTTINENQTYTAAYTRVDSNSTSTRRFFYPHYVNSPGSYHASTLQYGRGPASNDAYTWENLPKTEGTDGGYYKDIRAGDAISINIVQQSNVPYVPDTVVLNGTMLDLPTGWTWNGSATTSANYWQGNANDQYIYDSNGQVQAKVDVRLMLNYSNNEISGGRLRIVFEEIHGNIILDRVNLTPSNYPSLIVTDVEQGISGTVTNTVTPEQDLIPGAAGYTRENGNLQVEVGFGYYLSRFVTNFDHAMVALGGRNWYDRSITYSLASGDGNYAYINPNPTNLAAIETDIIQFTLGYDRDGADGGMVFNDGTTFTMTDNTSVTPAIISGMEPMASGKVFVGWALKPNAQYGVDELYQAGQIISRQAVEAAASTSVKYSTEEGQATIVLYPVLVDSSDSKLTSYSVQIHHGANTQQYNYSGAIIGSILARDEILALSDVANYIQGLAGYAMDAVSSDALITVEDTGATVFHLYYYPTAAVDVTFVSDPYGFDGTDQTSITKSYTPNVGMTDVPVPAASETHTFVGWSTLSPDDLVGALALTNLEGAAAPQGDTTYYAVYRQDVTVSFYTWEGPSGWSSTPSKQFLISSGAALSTAPTGDNRTVLQHLQEIAPPNLASGESPNHPGYSFRGWSRNGPSGGAPVFSADLIDYTFNENTSFYAIYSPQSDITVTLNANGGTFTNSQERIALNNLTVGTSIVGSTGYQEPTRNGYIFAGWSTDQNATVGMLYPDVPINDDEYFAIWVRPNLNVMVSGTYTYNGRPQTPTITVEYNGAPVTGGSYQVSYTTDTTTAETEHGAPIAAGTYGVVVTYNGVSGMAMFTINPKSINTSGIAAEYGAEELIFGPGELTTSVTITDSNVPEGKQTLVLNQDYVVNWTGENEVGATRTVTITGTENYTGTITKDFSVLLPESVTPTVSDIPSQPWTASGARPIPTVTYNGTELIYGVDFTVTYENNTEVGRATAVVNFTGNYSTLNPVEKTFWVTAGENTLNVVVNPPTLQVGAGTPTISVTLLASLQQGGRLLESNQYTLTYEKLNETTQEWENADSGMAAAGIYRIHAQGVADQTGFGNATGMATFVRTSVSGQGSLTISGLPSGVLTYNGSNHNTAALSTLKLVTTSATGGYTQGATVPSTLSISGPGVTMNGVALTEIHSINMTQAGAYTVTLTSTDSNVNGSASTTIYIQPRDIAAALAQGDIVLQGTWEKEYDGQPLPEDHSFQIVDQGLLDAGSYTLTAADYDLQHTAHSQVVDAGSYPVVVEGKGNYTGRVEKDFVVTPRQITVSQSVSYEYGFMPDLTALETTAEQEAVAGDVIDVHLYVDPALPVGNDQRHLHGSMSVTTGKASNYELVITGTVNVSKADISDTTNFNVTTTPSLSYNGQNRYSEISVAVTRATNGAALSGSQDYTVEIYPYVSADEVSATPTTTVKDVGEYQIVITATENGNYTGTRTANFQITAVSDAEGLGKLSVQVAPEADLTYTGEPIEPALIVTYTTPDGTQVTLASNDYRVVWPENHTDAGLVKITVEGLSSNYQGMSGTASYQIGRRAVTATNVVEIGAVEDQTYTGNPLTPKPLVTNVITSQTLVEGKDYSLSYSNNINVTSAEDPAQVIVYGMGNYTGNKVVTFHINAVGTGGGEGEGGGGNQPGGTAQNLEIQPIPDQIYTGLPITPAPVVTFGGKTLVQGSDYTVSYSIANPTQPGQYTVTVTGTGNYDSSLTAEATFLIKVSHLVVKVNYPQLAVGSGTPTFTVELPYTNTEVESGNYDLVYQVYNGSQLNPTGAANLANVGMYLITATGKGEGYQGATGSVTFVRTPASGGSDGTGDFTLSGVTGLNGGVLSLTYNGLNQNTALNGLTVSAGSDGSTPLVESTDYDLLVGGTPLAQADMRNAGTYAVTIDGKGNYADSTATITVNISPLDISGSTVAEIGSVSYDANQLPMTATVNVTDNRLQTTSKQLTVNTDYTLTNASHSSAGTYTVVVVGKGNFTGVNTTKTFTINQRTINATGTLEISYGQTPDYGQVQLSETLPTGVNVVWSVDAALDASGNLPVDTHNIIGALNGIGSSNYMLNSAATVVVSTLDIGGGGSGNPGGGGTGGVEGSTVEVSVFPESVPYTGQPQRPQVLVTHNDNTLLVENVDYTVKFIDSEGAEYDAPTAAGSYTVKITGMESGNFTGAITKTDAFTITPVTSGGGSSGGNLAIELTTSTYTYTGNDLTETIKQNVKVTYMGTQDVTDSSTITIGGTPTNVGTYTVTATYSDGDSFTGTVSANVTIIPKSLGSGVTPAADIVLTPPADVEYTGDAWTPDVVLAHSGGKGTLIKDTDYYLSYTNNVNTGTATITITGIRNYSGTLTTTFTINAATGSGGSGGGSATTPGGGTFAVAEIPDQIYTGSKIQPGVTVTFTTQDGKVITLSGNGVDYSVEYGTNTSVGANTGTVTITGTGDGNYAGLELTQTFDILAGSLVVSVDEPQLPYLGNDPIFTVNLPNQGSAVAESNYTLTYQKYSGGSLGAPSLLTDPETQLDEAGMYLITATGVGIGYAGATGTVTFVRTPAGSSIDGGSSGTGDAFTVGGVVTSLTYNGQNQMTAALPTGSFVVQNTSGNNLMVTTDYVVEISADNGSTYHPQASANMTDAGLYLVRVSGQGNYEGSSVVIPVTVNPKDIKDATITGDSTVLTYDTTAQTYTITVTDADATITSNDYTITGNVQTNAGSYTAVVTGKGNYTGAAQVNFTINPMPVTASGTLNVVYGAQPDYSQVSVTPALPNGVSAVWSVDATGLDGNGNLTVGTHDIVGALRGTGASNYSLTSTADVVVSALDIGQPDEGNDGGATTPTVNVMVVPASLVYNGNEQEPQVIVSVDNQLLASHAYTVSYQGTSGEALGANNKPVNVGTYDVTVTVNDVNTMFSGTITKAAAFTIIPAGSSGGGSGGGVGSSSLKLSVANQTYTGQSLAQTFTDMLQVTYDNEQVTDKSKVSVTFNVADSSVKNVGTYVLTATYTGDANYPDGVVASTTVNIVAKSIASEGITVGTISDMEYTGSALMPTVTVTHTGANPETLTQGSDYFLSYTNNVDAGQATVTITGVGNYTGSTQSNFTINAAAVDGGTIGGGTTTEGGTFTVASIPDQIYTGLDVTPTVVVTYTPSGGSAITLTEGENSDYTVSYSNNNGVGQATATITGRGNYAGLNLKQNFHIVANSLVVTLDPPQLAYGPNDPAINVTLPGSDAPLVLNNDYTLTYQEYSGNTLGESSNLTDPTTQLDNAGMYLITATGAAGTGFANAIGTAVFVRTSSSEEGLVVSGGDLQDGVLTRTYDGSNWRLYVEENLTPAPTTNTDASLTWTTTVSYNGGTPVALENADITNAGTYTVTYTATSENHQGASAVVTVIIQPKQLDDTIVKDIPATTYNPEGTPAATVAVEDMADGASIITPNDYTVTGTQQTSAGTHMVTVVGKGNYTGVVTKDFVVSPMEIVANGSLTIVYGANPNFTHLTTTPAELPAGVSGIDWSVTQDVDANGNLPVGGPYPITGVLVGDGASNYTLSSSANVTVQAVSIDNPSTGNTDGDEPPVIDVKIAPANAIYNGMPQAPEVIVSIDGQMLTANDYRVSYIDENNASGTPQNVGKYDVVITGAGDRFQGVITKTDAFEILTSDPSSGSGGNSDRLTLVVSDLVYTGNSLAQTIRDNIQVSYQGLSDDAPQLVTDSYTVRFNTADAQVKDVGTYLVTVTYIGDQNVGAVTAVTTVEITKKDISEASTDISTPNIPEAEYAGVPVTPSVTLTHTNAADQPVLNEDYFLSYSDNINVGQATVTITGVGNYTGTRDVPFNIVAAKGVTPGEDVGDTAESGGGTFKVSAINDQTYTGRQITPAPVVTFTRNSDDTVITLTQGVDYDLSWGENINVGVGVGVVNITGREGSNYEGLALKQTFNIVAGSLAVTVDQPQMTLGGGTPAFTVTLPGSSTALTAGTHYTLSYQKYPLPSTSNPLDNAAIALADVGMYLITATGMVGTPYANATGAVTFVRTSASSEDGGLTVSGTGLTDGLMTLTYTGNNQVDTVRKLQVTPNVSSEGFQYEAEVSFNGQTPVRLDDPATAMVDAGLYTVTYTGTDANHSTDSATITVIIEPKKLTEGMLGTVASQVYSGREYTFAVALTDTEPTDTARQVLTQDTDYTLSGNKQTNAGSYSMTVTGKGNYAGTLEIPYQITKAPLTVAGTVTIAYGDTPDLTVSTDGGANKLQISGIRTPVDVLGTNVIVTLTPAAELVLGKNDITGGLSGASSGNYTLDCSGAKIQVNKLDIGSGGGEGSVPGGDGSQEPGIGNTFSVEIYPESAPYTGAAHTPRLIVTHNETLLTMGTDYNVSYEATGTAPLVEGTMVNVGSYDVVITGIGNYAGSVKKAYSITAASDTTASGLVVMATNVIYTGSDLTEAIKNQLNVTFNGQPVLSTHYDVTFSVDGTTLVSPENVGTYLVQVKANGNAAGSNYQNQSGSGVVQILAKNLEDAVGGTITCVVLNAEELYFDGSPKTPKVSVEYEPTGGTPVPLVEGTDYYLSYENNVNAGEDTAKILITGVRNYTGVREEVFTILPAGENPDLGGDGSGGDGTETTDPENPMQGQLGVQKIPDQIYTGEAITVEPVVTFNGRVLTKDEDYTIGAWSNGTTSIGTHQAAITGIKNYEGLSVMASFRIVAGELVVTVDPAQAPVGGADPAIEVTLVDGLTVSPEHYDLTYTRVGGAGGALNVDASGVVTDSVMDSVGMYQITATGKSTDSDYKTATGSSAFVRTPASTSGGGSSGSGTAGSAITVTGVTTSLIYNGADQNQGALSGIRVTGVGGETLYDVISDEGKENTNKTYKVEISVDNGETYRDASTVEIKNVGLYLVRVSGQGDYNGSVVVLPVVMDSRDIAAAIADGSITVSDTGSVFTYDPNETRTYSVTISDSMSRKNLVLNTDYTITGNQQTNAGDYTVTITGTGNYTGVVTRTFTIQPATITATGTVTTTYGTEPDFSTVTLDPADTGVTLVWSVDTQRDTMGNLPVTTGDGYGVTVGITGTDASNYVVDATGVKVVVNKLDITDPGTGGGDTGGDGENPSTSGFQVSISPTSGVFNNQPHTPAVFVTYNGMTVPEEYYTVTYYQEDQQVNSMINAGTYAVRVSATTVAGNPYTGSVDKSYTISPPGASGALTVNLGTSSVVYDGRPVTQDELGITVTGPGDVVVTDFTITDWGTVDGNPPTDVGSYLITVTSNDESTKGSKGTAILQITAKSLEDVIVTPIPDYYFTGSTIRPTVEAHDDQGNLLTLGVDYLVSYGENVSVGENSGSITITGIGNYTGIKEEIFGIVTPGQTGGDTEGTAGTISIQPIPNQYYNGGQAIEPEVVVTFTTEDGNKITLTRGEDFEVMYGNNTEIGTGTVEIRGMGNYADMTASSTFEIVAEDLWLDVAVTPAAAPLGGNDPEITVALLGVDVTAQAMLTYQTYDENGNLVPCDASALNTTVGVYVITAAYEGASGTATFVRMATDDDLTVGGGGTDTSTGGVVDDLADGFVTLTYNGQNQSDVLNGMTVTSKDGATLDLGEDYTLQASYNGGAPVALNDQYEMIDAGAYVVTITGQGTYANSSTSVVVLINPKNIGDITVEAAVQETVYNSTVQSAEVSVTDGGVGLNGGNLISRSNDRVDYTLSNDQQTNAGTWPVVISGVGNYVGTRVINWTITPVTLYVTGTVTMAYGDALPDLKDSFEVKEPISADYSSGKIDWTIHAPSPLNAGTHAPIVALSGEAAGNYTVDTSGASIVVTAADMTNPGDGSTDPDTDADGDGVLDPDKDSDGDGNIEDENGDGTIETIGGFLVSMTPTMSYYNGQPQAVQVSVTHTKDGQTTTLTENQDYKVTYLDSEGAVLTELIEIGTYTVLVEGMGNYSGSFELTYTIEATPSGGGGILPDPNPGPDVTNPNGTGVSDWLITDQHIAYLKGYGTTFQPGANMTRAEVAQMFYNLLRDKDVTITSSFADVPVDQWYAVPVNTLASLGIIQGVGDNLFVPDSPITRAEFVAIAMRFTKQETGSEVGDMENIFMDVTPDSWYYEAALGAVSYGWIQGYGNGRFFPEANITRAEVTTIANRMLGRQADREYVDSHESEMIVFSDVPKNNWAYYQVMEAVNAHGFTTVNGTEEIWIGS